MVCLPFRAVMIYKFSTMSSSLKNERGIKKKLDIKEENDGCEIEIGEHYMVLKRDNNWMPAEILQKRVSTHSQGSFEYFVHFDGLNRRLDEWVPAKRIKLPALDKSNNANKDKLEVESDDGERKMTRNKKKIQEENTEIPARSKANLPKDPLEVEYEAITKIKFIDTIQFGQYEIDTWYFSPYPDEYGNASKLWICEFCLKYMRLEKSYRFHIRECNMRAPPGKQIYQKGTLLIYEVDAVENRLYCQNLCLLAKLFLDHKTIFFDVEPFLFYVLCELDHKGSHLVGYFSKEKESEGNNVACILTLPPFQRQGFGKLLIAFSYELSKLEGVVGSPEKPLSDLGRLSYTSYWSWIILNILKDLPDNISIHNLSEMTSITEEDIISTLESLNMLKYWDSLKNEVYITPDFVYEHIQSAQFKRPRLTVDSSALCWEPPKKRHNRLPRSLREEDPDTE